MFLGTEREGTLNKMFITKSFLKEMNILTDVEKAMDVLVKKVKETLVEHLRDKRKPKGGNSSLNVQPVFP